MNVYIYTADEKIFIDTYDLKDHNFWNINSNELAPLRLNLRKHYLSEQNNRCCYCKMLKQEKHGLTWDIEHIVPKANSPHFLFEPLNLSLSCKECNEAKSNQNVLSQDRIYAKYPQSSDKYKIIHPHFDKYSDHMNIRIMPFGEIFHIPKSEKGKCIFHLCDLVRFSMQSLNVENVDKNLLISFSNFIDGNPSLTPDVAKAFFTASLPRLLTSDSIDC